ncbi:hypothetical protein [Paremcibacter congregatus]|nr:hypothetical protein [Paremcibacter congregatus]QDE26185.1 hypothetical protein FIV45_02210 [Paremcibacter congregatus]
MIILISPVFIGYSLGEGIVFDSTPFNRYMTPSLPIGIFTVFILFLFHLRQIKLPISHFMALLVLLGYLLLSISTPLIMRSIPLFLGMVVPICNYYLVKHKIENSQPDFNYYRIFKHVCWALIWMKFLTDILFFKTIVTEFLISDAIAIYNFYDYFPFFYCLSLFIIVNDAINDEKISIFKVLTALICFAATFNAYSRVFQAIIIIGPCLIVYFKIVPFNIKTLSYTLISLLAVLTVVIGIYFYDNFSSDASLTLRFGHWHEFFLATSLQNIFLPLLNPYRQLLNFGTTHNELLEIYSLFGLGFFFFVKVFTDFFEKGAENTHALRTTILASLLLGAFIQLNITNPHLGILWSTLVALTSNIKTAAQTSSVSRVRIY